MMRATATCFTVVFVLLFWSNRAESTIEHEIQKTLRLEGTPLDVTTSADGRFTFVLLEGGLVSIYSPDGDLKGSIRVREDADGIHSAPRGEQLYVTSRQAKTMEIVSIDFVREIDTSGAPFKGPADAPVTVAVFSDFQ